MVVLWRRRKEGGWVGTTTTFSSEEEKLEKTLLGRGSSLVQEFGGPMEPHKQQQPQE